MTYAILMGIVMSVISLIFSFVPGLKQWFENFKPEAKQLFMLIATIVVAGGIFGLGCAGLISVGTVCTWKGAWDLVVLIFVGIVSNQGTYAITSKLSDAAYANK